MISTLSGTGERIATPDSSALSGTPLLGPNPSTATGRQCLSGVARRQRGIQTGSHAGRLQRIAGTGQRGYAGDGGPGLDATFNGPKGIAYSGTDNSLYIVDTENHVLRRLSLNSGLISTVLGSGERGICPDGDPLNCYRIDPTGSAYIAAWFMLPTAKAIESRHYWLTRLSYPKNAVRCR